SDQIQTPQYPDVHVPSQEMNEEVFQAEGEQMKSIQTFLEKFICIPFEEKPQILFQAWEIFFAIQYSKLKDPNELFQKLLEDLKELVEYENSQSRDRPIFLNDDEDHSDQNKECFENSSDENATLNSNEEKEEPPQDSDIYQLIEECSTEVYEIIKSGVKELVPILSENEVTSEDKRECDVPVCENSPVCDDHSEIFSDSKDDDDISVYDDDFEDIEYVEASLPNPEIVSIEEENDVNQEEEEVDLEDISQIQDVDLQTRSDTTTTHANDSLPEYDSFCFEIEPDQERLINVLKSDIFDESTNDPLLEEADLFLASDNSIPPDIENFGDNSEGDIRFLKELLIDDSILSHESSDSNFEDNPSVS
nr:hypothetical protein [Tanacetum cinerariifolium]